MAINAGTVAAYLTLDTEKFDKGIKSVNAQLRALEDSELPTANKVRGLGSALTEMGVTMTKNVTIPIGGAGVAAMKMYSDYESAFAGVRKTVDATEEEYQKLSDGIIDMSKRMPTAATEIAGVMEAAGQLGIEKGSLESFTETMVMLGDSTNLSANEAASSLAKFANVTNMSASDYGRLGSTIVDLGNNFATTETDIVEMGTRLASTGNLVGLSEPQIMAVATALSSCGIEADAGGSAVSKLLKQIDVAAKTFEQSNSVINSTGYSLRELEMLSDRDNAAFKKVAASLGLTSDELENYMNHAGDLNAFSDVAGVSAEEFVKAWGEDAVGALGMFINGLNDTERNGKSAVEILDDMGINEVRLSNAVLSLASSNGILTESVDTANMAWNENTALSHEAEERYSTFASQCTITLNKVKDLGIGMGKELLPVAEDLIDTAGEIVSWFSSLDSGTKRMIVNAGMVAASIGPVSTVIGKVTTCIGSLMTAAEAAGGGLAGFGSGLLNLVTPAGLTSVAVTGVVVACMSAYNWFENTRNKVTEFDKVMEETAESTKNLDEATKVLDNLKEARQENYVEQTQELTTVESLKTKLAELVNKDGKLTGSKKELADVVKQLNENGFKVELNKTGDLVENYKDLTDSIDKYIEQKKAQAMVDALEPEYQNALKNQAKYYSTYVKKLNDALELKKMLNDEDYVSELSTDQYNRLVEDYNTLNNEASQALENYKSSCNIVKAYSAATASIAEGDYAGAIEMLNDYYSGVGEIIKKNSEYAKDEQEKAINELSAQFTEQIQAYGAAMQTGDEAVIEDAKTYLEQAASELKAAGVELTDGFVEGIENGSISVEDAINQLGELSNAAVEKIAVDNEAGAKMKEAYSNLVDSEIYDKLKDLNNEIESENQRHKDVVEKIRSDINSGNGNITALFADLDLENREHHAKIDKLNDEIADSFSGSGQDIVDSLIWLYGEMQANDGILTDEQEEFVKNIVACYETLPSDLQEKGADAVNGLNKGLLERQSLIIETATSLSQAIPDIASGVLDEHSPSKVMDKIGGFAVQGLINGMDGKKSGVTSAMGSIVQSAVTAAGSVSFVGVGKNIIGGIMSGLDEKKPSLLTAAGNIASSISKKIKSALKINSPSRVMMEIGEFTTAGMELGLIQGAGSLYDTASAISAETAEALSGITEARFNYPQYPVNDYGDKIDRLIDAVERLADSQPTVEIDGRPFGRLVRECV